MIKRFTHQIQSVSAAAIIISAFSLITKFLGIFRDHLLAKNFGAGAELDIYYAAFRLPDFIMNLLILGVVSAGLIPIMTKYLAQGEKKEKFWDLLNNLVNLYFLTFGLIALIFLVFVGPIMKVLTPGFSPEQLETVVSLTRIMLISPLLLGLSSLFGSGVQVHKQFILYSVAPFLYNLGIIFGIIMLAPIYGINGVVFGVLIGAFLHLFMQWSGMKHLGYKYRWFFQPRNKDVKLLLKMALPRFLTLGMSQFNFIIITIVATTLAEGSLSIFNFANNLQSLPLSLFGIPFAIASFPILSSHFQEKSWEKYYDLFYKTFKQILFFVIPATVGFILLRAQVVRLVLGSGKFDWQDTILTMETLAMFTLSLIAQSLLPLLVRAFYAIENTITPFIIVFISTIINVILTYTLIDLPVPAIFHEYLQCETLGVLGLALAYSIGSIIQMVLLWIVLRRKVLIKKTKSYKVFKFIIQNIFASIFLGLGVQLGKWIWGQIFDLSESWQVLGQAGLAFLFGVSFYYVIMKILKVEEFLYWEKKILSKVKTILYANSKRS